ncbi:hypothetical protein H0X06_00755 [Candidatus Dependentiae bacterium]|nr:hypothetical protein [Candidatus Dependentiae bacterium]
MYVLLKKTLRASSCFTLSICCMLFITVGNKIAATDRWALVKVPSADLSAERLSRFQGLPPFSYSTFPCAPDKGFSIGFRIHQLKFNELVKVQTCLKDEVECEVQHFFYRGHDKKDYKTFWIDRKDLVFLKDLPPKEVLSSVPPPCRMSDFSYQCNKNVLTLISPWSDLRTRKTYSAGTRFMRCSAKDTKDRYAVFILDMSSFKSVVSYVPTPFALISYPQKQFQARALFVQVLKEWAHNHNGIIPYVFGGCSHNGKIISRGFSIACGLRDDEKISYWHRNHIQSQPLSGFDCSSMILCAAQICGIPYFYKNSFTLYYYMKTLKENEKLQEGDLLWYSGHVMIVSDVKKNLLIEAAGYDTGYGKVHEISIDKLFQGIKNYTELIACCKRGNELKRLHSKGHPYKSIENLKILALKSLWDIDLKTRKA